MARIFICYRRENARGYAGRIYDHLRTMYPEKELFYDRESLKPGAPWPDYIRREFGDCEYLLVVIQKNWHTIQDSESGARRLDEPGDWVRLEIEAGLSQKSTTVIPVLVGDDSRLPLARWLPPSIRPLVDGQSFTLDEQDFRGGVEKLADHMGGKAVQPTLKTGIEEASNPDVALLLKEIRNELTALRPTPLTPQVAPIIHPADGLRYVWIPPGEFTMGCSPWDSECYEDESPAHPVRITKGFWMSESAVTQAAYQKVMGRNPSQFRGADLPVEQISWDDAVAYCSAVGGRLPTEAEWEYAARGGDPRARYGELDQIAWYGKNSGGTTHSVKGLLPNRFGLYDMLGNVWEWTADWYGPYEVGAQADPKGPADGTGRVVRGGSWMLNSLLVRASYRRRDVPGLRDDLYGFRCVRD